DILIQSQLNGVWFFEHFGNEIPLPIDEDLTTGNLYFSLAGHAPHTTSPELFRELKRKSFGKPFSIHVAESDLEMEFIKHAKGSWADFLVSREVDFSKWGLPQKSPVKHLDHIGILDKQTLIVHLLHCDDSDLSILKNRQCSVCICPRSNHNLHKRLPNIEDMIKKGLNVCLGTDSLASVNSLSIWDEMKYIWANYPNLSPKRILSMATSAGAMALGCGHQLGRIEPGYRACLLYVPVDSSNDENIAHHLVAADTVEKHLSLL
ncbi:Amidohydrolase, partial [Candidatus Magnetomorum sp. HK-1]